MKTAIILTVASLMLASVLIIPSATAGPICEYEDFGGRLDKNGATRVSFCVGSHTSCYIAASGAWVQCRGWDF